ncbi:aminoglycoside phosphotransferase family protein [Legionella waltersii]|uniref:Aminoglycoside/hydroxyurea antibiotic resistance kinase n=1 Tax=Legionella waltersii TaxID=66969 RepID=A0A0W1AMS6_9GAMM|nr:aminoglycoside phosphotransferase family protein [Legionella waltersii]KTD82631.1 Aminoglycoside/hydroxyurea antibiotic resistance kinase [Legionella waltersii]SNV07979.1 Aminoglycoside/hydroxyurea antibiotic resistance kinase [Legionella waltersii]
MELTPQFRKTIEAVYGETGKRWLQRLPVFIRELEQQWDVHFIRPVAELSFNFVGLVRFNSNDQMAVIKTAPSGEHLVNEIHCMLCFSNATPRVYQHDEKRFAFLMEYISPGYSLKTFLNNESDINVTRIIAQTIRELQTGQQKKYTFKHLSELVGDLKSLEGHVDARMLAKAEFLFRELTSDRTNDVVLHGDLHHDNIIRRGSSWAVIDPQGYLGDPVAEVGAMIRNPMDCFPNDRSPAQIVQTRLTVLKEELPFDPQKIKAWAFVITVLSAAWNMHDFNHLAESEIELASLIDKVKI